MSTTFYLGGKLQVFNHEKYTECICEKLGSLITPNWGMQGCQIDHFRTILMYIQHFEQINPNIAKSSCKLAIGNQFLHVHQIPREYQTCISRSRVVRWHMQGCQIFHLQCNFSVFLHFRQINLNNYKWFTQNQFLGVNYI